MYLPRELSVLKATFTLCIFKYFLILIIDCPTMDGQIKFMVFLYCCFASKLLIRDGEYPLLRAICFFLNLIKAECRNGILKFVYAIATNGV